MENPKFQNGKKQIPKWKIPNSKKKKTNCRRQYTITQSHNQHNQHKMTVCFIANFSKTYFFHAIAKQLQKRGINIVWLVNNEKLYDFLKEHYLSKNILYINREYMSGEDEAVGEFKINELVFGDRVLRHEKKNGLRFLTNIQRPIYNFLQEHQVRKVFGETTWAHEILAHRMVSRRAELDCIFLNPHVIRIPNARFAFFTDEHQSQLFKLNRAEGFDGIFELKKPDYLIINDKKLKKNNSLSGRLNRVKRFISNENIDQNDPTHLTNEVVRFKTRAGEEWRKETYKSIQRIDFEEVENTPYVFIGLHKQPEASIDVFGRYYEDQLVNIQNIWRALPQGWKLLIKEHTNAIGDRSKAFYQTLNDLPNVHFIHEKTNSWQLIHQAQLVATVTGTIAYEAALMQVPALTLAPTFFNAINYCQQINWNELNACKDLSELCAKIRSRKDNRQNFCDMLWRNSFPGTFSDPNSNPAILEAENVHTIAAGFMHILHADMLVLN